METVVALRMLKNIANIFLPQEVKKREKEQAEQQKAQAKLDKERSQMRLSSFFQNPATPAKNTGEGSQPGEFSYPCYFDWPEYR